MGDLSSGREGIALKFYVCMCLPQKCRGCGARHSMSLAPQQAMSTAMGSPHTLETPTSTLQMDIWTSQGKFAMCITVWHRILLHSANSSILRPHPPAAAGPKRGVIILHPWAKLGGSMEDPTVLYTFRCKHTAPTHVQADMVIQQQLAMLQKPQKK